MTIEMRTLFCTGPNRSSSGETTELPHRIGAPWATDRSWSLVSPPRLVIATKLFIAEVSGIGLV